MSTSHRSPDLLYVEGHLDHRVYFALPLPPDLPSVQVLGSPPIGGDSQDGRGAPIRVMRCLCIDANWDADPGRV